MKKIVFAFVCLISAAFFTSCGKPVENPEPSITFKTGENYLFQGQTVDLDRVYYFGFIATSNAQTKKELASVRYVVRASGDNHTKIMIDTTFTVSGSEWEMNDTLAFPMVRELVGQGTITVTVTDVDKKKRELDLFLNINKPSMLLSSKEFEWFRLGDSITGLKEFGLVWESNQKDTYAQIKPLEGVTMHKFNDMAWDDAVTEFDKASLFAYASTEIYEYVSVSSTSGGSYKDVIGTKMPDGTLHLIIVRECVIGEFQPQGYPITIMGEYK